MGIRFKYSSETMEEYHARLAEQDRQKQLDREKERLEKEQNDNYQKKHFSEMTMEEQLAELERRRHRVKERPKNHRPIYLSSLDNHVIRTDRLLQFDQQIRQIIDTYDDISFVKREPSISYLRKEKIFKQKPYFMFAKLGNKRYDYLLKTKDSYLIVECDQDNSHYNQLAQYSGYSDAFATHIADLSKEIECLHNDIPLIRIRDYDTFDDIKNMIDSVIGQSKIVSAMDRVKKDELIYKEFYEHHQSYLSLEGGADNINLLYDVAMNIIKIHQKLRNQKYQW